MGKKYRRINRQIEEQLDHKNLEEITTKCHSDQRKHEYELVDEPKKNLTELL